MPDQPLRQWATWALAEIAADTRRSGETPLLRLDLAAYPGVRLYLKDESAHPSGSLKHRLARSLFVNAVSSGWLYPGRPVIEASSGSTAVSEAWFARLLGLPFIAVIPEGTSPEKMRLIRSFGGECHVVPPGTDTVAEAATLAAARSGHFMDQFRYAERVSAPAGPGSLAASIFRQLRLEEFPEPDWIVVGIGTGGTGASIGRYLRLTARATQLCAVDPPGSCLFGHWSDEAGCDGCPAAAAPTLIEGIGRPCAGESFLPSVIDAMARVPDEASLAALRLAERALSRRVGGSTGTSLAGALALAKRMHRDGRTGNIVALLCDGGERYSTTLYDADWLTARGLADVGGWEYLLLDPGSDLPFGIQERTRPVCRDSLPAAMPRFTTVAGGIQAGQ